MKSSLDPSLVMTKVTEEIARHRSPTELPNFDQTIEELPFSQAVLLYNDCRINDGAPLSNSTHKNNCLGLNCVLEVIGDLPFREMRHAAVYDEIRRASKVAPTTRNQALILAGKVTSYFLRRGWIGWKADTGTLVTILGKEQFTPSVEELGALEKALMALHPRRTKTKSKMMHYSLRLALVMQYFCGFRRGAIEAITWDAIHSNKVALVVPKTRRFHQIPLHPILSRYLDTYVQAVEWDGPPKIANTDILNLMRTQPHVDIMPEIREKRIFRFTGEYLNEQYKRASKHANLPGLVTTHAVRRTSLSEWTVAGGTECFSILHGCGMTGMKKRYWHEQAILRAHMHKLAYPSNWLSPAQQQQGVIERMEFMAMYDSFTPEEREAVLTVGRSMTKDRPRETL